MHVRPNNGCKCWVRTIADKTSLSAEKGYCCSYVSQCRWIFPMLPASNPQVDDTKFEFAESLVFSNWYSYHFSHHSYWIVASLTVVTRAQTSTVINHQFIINCQRRLFSFPIKALSLHPTIYSKTGYSCRSIIRS